MAVFEGQAGRSTCDDELVPAVVGRRILDHPSKIRVRDPDRANVGEPGPIRPRLQQALHEPQGAIGPAGRVEHEGMDVGVRARGQESGGSAPASEGEETGTEEGKIERGIGLYPQMSQGRSEVLQEGDKCRWSLAAETSGSSNVETCEMTRTFRLG